MKKHVIIIKLLVASVVLGLLGCEKEGLDGNNSLINIEIESVGENCSSGGYKIITGLDLNNNNILENNEIQNTDYICNGEDGSNGYSSLVNVVEEPAGEECSSGGYRINSGIDLNNNNVLDENEILNSEYICNSDLDKEMVIKLTSNISNNTAYPHVFSVNLPYFDITAYENLTSVVFIVSDIKTSDYNFNDVIGEGTFELYDITNGQVIENSIISSDDITDNTYLSSQNLIDKIPQEKINLGVRLTSGGDFNSRCGNIYLILSRE